MFVLPKFEDFFDEFDAKLPLTTRILLDIADFLDEYGVFLAPRACRARRARHGVLPHAPAGVTAATA